MGGLNLVEHVCAAFQPFLDLRAGDLHRAHGVEIEVEISDILDRDIALGHGGVIFRVLASANLERAAADKVENLSFLVSCRIFLMYWATIWKV